MSLAPLIERQVEAEAEHRLLFQRLDHARTVTLRELLTDAAAPERLQAPWLNLAVIQTRFGRATEWLHQHQGVGRVRGWQHLGPVFFQASPLAEDEAEHSRRLADPYGFCYAERFQDLPAQAAYLVTNYGSTPVGMEEGWQRGWTLWPLSGFSSLLCFGGDAVWREYFRSRRTAVGNRVPDWPSLLGVGGAVATEYLVRLVIHDLGHSFLPTIGPLRESYHNVMMLRAGGGPGLVDPGSDWESLVLAECTDPYFPMQAARLLESWRDRIGELTPVQRFLLNLWSRWYVPTCSRRRQRYWGLRPRMDEGACCRQADRVLDAIVVGGFAAYHDRDDKRVTLRR
ncbi:hypothetical protein HY375_01925 [Candidatus Berkelbacteria bacterium]|nr:hypothetical protein [Candidatus Berkelbacteria bacterium]